MKLMGILMLTLLSLPLRAQCPLENNAFQGGEVLEYKLFFNWKFVWLNAGSATLRTESITHKGKPALRSHLITRTSKRLDKFFQMRDTLEAVYSPRLVPHYYRKGANEGGKYRLNVVEYSYPGGQTQVDLLYQNPYGDQTRDVLKQADCVYDMLSMMFRARNFDGRQFKKGDRLNFLMADGKNVEQQTVVYRGIKNFTTEDDKEITYRCMVFSFVEKQGKKEKEIITFYITDDQNHLPVRLDMFLRFGVAKAFLKTATGVRNPQTSILKQKK